MSASTPGAGCTRLLEGQELKEVLTGKEQGKSKRGRTKGNLKVPLVKEVKKELVEAIETSRDEDIVVTKSLPAPLTKKEKLLRTKGASTEGSREGSDGGY